MSFPGSRLILWSESKEAKKALSNLKKNHISISSPIQRDAFSAFNKLLSQSIPISKGTKVSIDAILVYTHVLYPIIRHFGLVLSWVSSSGAPPKAESHISDQTHTLPTPSFTNPDPSLTFNETLQTKYNRGKTQSLISFLFFGHSAQDSASFLTRHEAYSRLVSATRRTMPLSVTYVFSFSKTLLYILLKWFIVNPEQNFQESILDMVYWVFPHPHILESFFLQINIPRTEIVSKTCAYYNQCFNAVKPKIWFSILDKSTQSLDTQEIESSDFKIRINRLRTVLQEIIRYLDRVDIISQKKREKEKERLLSIQKQQQQSIESETRSSEQPLISQSNNGHTTPMRSKRARISPLSSQTQTQIPTLLQDTLLPISHHSLWDPNRLPSPSILRNSIRPKGFSSPKNHPSPTKNTSHKVTLNLNSIEKVVFDDIEGEDRLIDVRSFGSSSLEARQESRSKSSNPFLDRITAKFHGKSMDFEDQLLSLNRLDMGTSGNIPRSIKRIRVSSSPSSYISSQLDYDNNQVAEEPIPNGSDHFHDSISNGHNFQEDEEEEEGPFEDFLESFVEPPPLEYDDDDDLLGIIDQFAIPKHQELPNARPLASLEAGELLIDESSVKQRLGKRISTHLLDNVWPDTHFRFLGTQGFSPFIPLRKDCIFILTRW